MQRLTQPVGVEDATVPPATTVDAAAPARVFVGRPLSASRVDGLRTGSPPLLARLAPPLRPSSSQPPTHERTRSDGEHSCEEDGAATTSPREMTDVGGTLASWSISTPSLLGLSAVLSVPVATILGESRALRLSVASPVSDGCSQMTCGLLANNACAVKFRVCAQEGTRRGTHVATGSESWHCEPDGRTPLGKGGIGQPGQHMLHVSRSAVSARHPAPTAAGARCVCRARQ